MISFWVSARGAFGIEDYLALRGAPLRGRITVQLYEGLAQSIEAPAGAHIFSGLDQLGDAEREAVCSLYDQLARLQPGAPLLNDPRRCLLRPALLRVLAEAGLNSFRAFPLDEVRLVDRFPVFVREGSQHNGSLTPLIGSHAELGRAIRALRLRGYRRNDLLIVEFCDTSDRNGTFRKYSAFRVGKRIVATHVLNSENWMVKAAFNLRSPQWAQEGLAYAEQNPYEEWMEKVFSLAGIDYGRLDFAVLDGKPQAWEINLNPTLGRGPGTSQEHSDPATAAVRDQTRQYFHGRLRDAFAALEPEPVSGTHLLRLEPELCARIERERERARKRHAGWSLLRRLYHRPALGAPLRLLGNQLFPRFGAKS